jgi:cytochrome c oxidase subunit 3
MQEEIIEQETSLNLSSAELGLWAFIATATMLFAGFTSAIFVRRASADWQPIPVPSLLWCTTAIILASSITIERARALSKAGRRESLRRWLSATVGLGFLFVVGQLGAWRQLVSLGVYLPSNPHGSFFYMLTGAHAVHLFGGVLALVYLLVRSLKVKSAAPGRMDIALYATYWHFVGGLWVYLFIMLFVM